MTPASTVSAEPIASADAADAQTSRIILSEHERWAAWQARGAAHDRGVRRRMTFLAPILIAALVIAIAVITR